jgi:hypothetical protein
MNPLFKKLRIKEQTTILVLNAPPSFQAIPAEMETLATVKVNAHDMTEIAFALVFVMTQEEINTSITEIAPKLSNDAVIWYSYPKGTSKRYSCDFNRDNGWASLGQYGLERVSQVALDEDWSALRFRNVENIKTITRRESFALTTEAKKRTTKRGV